MKIFNKLLNALQLVKAIHDNPESAALSPTIQPIALDPQAYEQVSEAIQWAEWQKNLEKDKITLIIESQGDRSVGIGSDEIKITVSKGFIDTKDSREDIRTIFCNAAKDLWDFPIRHAFFEDECHECGGLIENDKCPNKDCYSNINEQ